MEDSLMIVERRTKVLALVEIHTAWLTPVPEVVSSCRQERALAAYRSASAPVLPSKIEKSL